MTAPRSLAGIDAAIAKHERAIDRLRAARLARLEIEARNAAILADFDAGKCHLRRLAEKHGCSLQVVKDVVHRSGRSALRKRFELEREFLAAVAAGHAAAEARV